VNARATIRLARTSDASAVAALLLELGCEVGIKVLETRLGRLGSLQSERVFVAEVGGHVVGLLSFHLAPLLHRDCFGRITAFVVNQEHRGRGIGSQLFCAAEEWALSQGCTQIEVTSGDHHEPAHGFYRSHGFCCDDRRFVKEEFD
jgi:GNAT superfamily N-acetyltransferase